MHYETIARNILRQHQTAITVIIKGFQPNYIKPSMKTR